MKRFLTLSLVLVFFLFPLTSQNRESIFRVQALPFASFPMGSSQDQFKPGPGINLDMAFIPSWLGGFGLGMGGEFLMLPIVTHDNISLLAAGLGPSFNLPLGTKADFYIRTRAGYFKFQADHWDTESIDGSSYLLSAGAGGSFRFGNVFSLGLGGFFSYYDKLYNGIGVTLYGQLDFGREKRERPVRDYTPDEKVTPLKVVSPKRDGKGVELEELSLITLFPVLYKYYDTNPVGTVKVTNFEDTVAEDITVKFYMERYMDNPMNAGESFSLQPGEEKLVDLYGLFTEDMMNITEGTKASARIELTYTMNGQEVSEEYNPILEVNNRNALIWNDDRKIASFITAKDPDILTFSKKVSNWLQEFENHAVDSNLQKGMILFEAVKSYGIRYEIDPTTPFSSFSEQTERVDFIQFPKQTLSYTTGDCDDLTALYTSLMESVGVETGIITIPGHIYMAFAMKSSPEDIRSNSSRSDEFIFRENKAWVPVEITMFQESFEEAWRTGAKEWRENSSRDQAYFFSTNSSWLAYQAVGYRESLGGVDMPSRSDVTAEFVKTISRYVQQEIYPQESAIRERMAFSDKKYIYQNKLAVLYSRFGLYDKAFQTLEEILASRDYTPALLNKGNIYYLEKDFDNALTWYEKVLSVDENNSKALLGAARCNHELENYGTVSKFYRQLTSVNSPLANRFAYLDLKGEEGQRAADALGLSEIVVWEEEE